MIALPALASNASASEGSQYELAGKNAPYGEVTRFGGFDSGWYDFGAYNGSVTESEPQPGLFLDPVGFAVDSEDASVKGEDHCASPDENAVWVLDRTKESEPTTSWRLQKLDDCGEVLGITEFTLPYNEETPSFVEGLAVDQKTETVYALVVHREESPHTSFAQEILEWSIAPSSSDVSVDGKSYKTLEAPKSATLDQLTTRLAGYSQPGLLAGETTLAETTKTFGSKLYKPQGIAIDDDASGNYVAIEAGTQQEGESGVAPAGPTVVQQVSQATGHLGSYWDSKTGLNGDKGSELETLASACTAEGTPGALCAQAAGKDGPEGLASDPATGGLTVLLNPGTSNQVGGEDLPYNVEVVSLSSELGEAKILSSEPLSGEVNAQGLENYDGAAIAEYQAPFLQARAKDVEAYDPSSPVTALSNGLYAAMFYNGHPVDSQRPGEGLPYWTDALGENSATGAVNLGVRLLDPERESGGTLSGSEPLTSVFDTLGQATGEVANQTPPVAAGKACNINAIASVAAGGGGSVWVITRGLDSLHEESTAGRQVIEIAPGEGTACPAPSTPSEATSFEIEGKSATTTSSSKPLTVSVGTTVNFEAGTVDYKSGTPYAYEWTQASEAGAGPTQTIADNAMSEAEAFHWPSSSTTYRYTEAGLYKVQLKLLGDYGEYVESGFVEVKSAEKPSATFTVSPESTLVGSPVDFEAVPSKEAAEYIWSFGDGSTDERKTTSDSHTYTAAGTYTVTLTVRDSDGQEGTSLPHTVTVTSPAVTKELPKSSPEPTPASPSAPLVPSPVAPVDKSPTNVDPIARAGKGEVEVAVSCPATKTLCAGTAEVRTASSVVSGKARKGKKAKKKVLDLGRASFSLAPGASKMLTLKLSSAGAALLRKDHTLKVDVVVAAHDAYGDPLTKTLGLTLSSTTAKKKKGHSAKKK